MTTRDQIAEQVLVLRCQMGDAEAFESLIRRYHARLLYFVRRLLGTVGSPDDVLQEVWLTAYRQIVKLDEPAAFRAWLYKIARHKALQSLRSSKKLAPLPEELEAPDEQPDEEPFSPSDAAKIHAGLERLRPEHREVLVLRFLEQMTYEEIGAVTGCELGTVKSRIYYGKRALRREIEEVDHDD